MNDMKDLIGIMTLVLMASCSREVQLTVVAEGLENDTLFVERCNFEERLHARGDRSAYRSDMDTLLFVDQRVEVTLPAEEPLLVNLYSPVYRRSDQGHVYHHPAGRIDLVVEPGEKLEVALKPHRHGHLTATISGSELNAAIARLDNQVRSVQIDMYANGFALNEAIRAKSKAVDSLRNRSRNIRSALHSVYAEYMKANPASEASAYCLYQMGPSRGEYYFRDLDKKIFRGVFRSVGELTERYVEEQEVRAELGSRIAEGADAPDFALLDPQGKSVTLSSHRGKWVVLDFWGTWCTWCIKGMPRLKKAYEEYRDRLEVIGIACGDKADQWRMAVEKMRLEWVNVIDPIEAPVEKSVSAIYAVEGYPTKVIITPEGKIHKIFQGESPEFYEELKRIME